MDPSPDSRFHTSVATHTPGTGTGHRESFMRIRWWNRSGRAARRGGPRPGPMARLRVEPLEHRDVPAAPTISAIGNGARARHPKRSNRIAGNGAIGTMIDHLVAVPVGMMNTTTETTAAVSVARFVVHELSRSFVRKSRRPGG